MSTLLDELERNARLARATREKLEKREQAAEDAAHAYQASVTLRLLILYENDAKYYAERLQVHMASWVRRSAIQVECMLVQDDPLELLQKENYQLIVVFLSPEFLLYDAEYELLEKIGKLESKHRVVPIRAFPCDWLLTPWGKLWSLPNQREFDGSLKEMNSAKREEALVSIVEELRSITSNRFI